MSPAPDERDPELSPEQARALMISSREGFIDSLSRTSPGWEATAELEGLRRIREAFDRAGGEGESGAVGPESAAPVFPGFRVLARVGAGGFAVVYRALDETLGREVALKVLSRRAGKESASRAEARAAFLDEARALASLRHENIVPIYSVLEHEGRQALVMEFIDGRSLDAIVEADGPLGPAEAAAAGCEIARALAAVHARGLVHRDVKPHNVLRRRGGGHLLGDFGLGVFMSAERRAAEESRVGGTPLSMSPEQVEGRRLDGRSDLYSLGVLLYFLLSGRWPCSPSEGGALRELFEAIRAGRLVPLVDRRPDLPPRLVAVIEKCLAREPQDRFQSAGELERALRESIAGGKGRSAPRGWTRRRAALAAALAIAACLGVLAALSLGRGRQGALSVDRAALWSLSRGVELRSGDSVSVGEELHLEFRAPCAAHLYVLNTDALGVGRLLFPDPRSRWRNPLAAGLLHVLPSIRGDGQGLRQWRIAGGGGGRETLFLVAALERWGELDALIAGEGVEWAAPEVAVGTLRERSRGFALGASRVSEPGSVKELFESLLAALAEDRPESRELRSRTWAAKVELRTP